MNKKMLIKTLTALIMVACVVPPFYFGGIAIHVLVVIVSALAAYETASLTDQKPHWLQTVINLCAMAAMYECSDSMLVAVMGIWLIVLFVEEMANERVNADFTAYTFLITMIVSLAWRGVFYFYNYQGFYLMVFTAFGAFITDTGAYFVGSFLGKHKMMPRISPNKTWEGSIGGYLCGSLMCLLFGLLALHSMPVGLIVTASLLMPVISEIGDLSFSSIKRRHSIKDFGNEFPGHGGILDRIDSYVFVVIFFHTLMIFWGL